MEQHAPHDHLRTVFGVVPAAGTVTPPDPDCRCPRCGFEWRQSRYGEQKEWKECLKCGQAWDKRQPLLF